MAPVLQFDEKFRQCFWDLASVKEQVREKAAAQLIHILVAEEKANVEEKKQLAYALTRLIRGLSSSRDGARQGFSTALTQVGSLSFSEGANETLCLGTDRWE